MHDRSANLSRTPRRTSRMVACAMRVIAVAALAVCTARVSAQVIPSELPPPVRGLSMSNTLGQRIPLDTQFTDEQGRSVSLKRYFNRRAASGKGDRPVIVQMMYFRCPILCPEVLKRLTAAVNEIDLTVGKGFDVLLVSFDPRDTSKDSAERKSAQLISYNRGGQDIASGWNFLTSTPESARALADALGFPFRALEGGEFSHGAALFVLTPDGKVSRSIVGLNYPAADVKLALLEASGGKIGTWKDAFVLWCYHFDPDAGTYTLAAMRVMRVGGALSILVVGTLLVALWCFEKRRRVTKMDRDAASSSATPTSPSQRTPLTVRLPGAIAPLSGSTS